MKKLDKKVIKLWLVRDLFAAIPTIVAYTLMVIFIPNDIKLALSLSFGLLVLVILFFCFAWPFISYHFYKYNYDETKIYINFGVVFRHKILIPVRQIQDLHLYNGPFMQLFKLSGVIISTAGSNFTLSGISKEVAEEMIFDLENKLESRLDADE